MLRFWCSACGIVFDDRPEFEGVDVTCPDCGCPYLGMLTEQEQPPWPKPVRQPVAPFDFRLPRPFPYDWLFED